MTTPSPNQILHEARKFVEQGWTTLVAARNSDGKMVHPESMDAVCWCVTGAIDRAIYEHDGFMSNGRGVHAARILMEKAIPVRLPEWKSWFCYNDLLETKEEALEWIDQAVEQAGDAGEDGNLLEVVGPCKCQKCFSFTQKELRENRWKEDDKNGLCPHCNYMYGTECLRL